MLWSGQIPNIISFPLASGEPTSTALLGDAPLMGLGPSAMLVFKQLGVAVPI